jgi:hypothetical protein
MPLLEVAGAEDLPVRAAALSMWMIGPSSGETNSNGQDLWMS